MTQEQNPTAGIEPTRLPRLQAGTLLNKNLIAWRENLLSWKDGNRDPITLAIAGEAGLGKSTATLDQIKAIQKTDPSLRLVYLVPSLDLAEELETKALGIGVKARVLRGRSQRQAGSGEQMCAKADLAETLSALNIAVGTTLCRREAEDGTVSECPHYATCPYIEQMKAAKEGGLIIASHQYLSVRMDALSDIDGLIVDESFWQVLASERRVDLGRFLTMRGTGMNFKARRGERRKDFEERQFDADASLCNAISRMERVFDAGREAGGLRLEHFRAEDFTGDECRALATVEYSRIKTPDLSPAMDYEEQKSLLETATIQEAFAFARIWKILAAELDTGRTGAPHGIVLEIGAINPKTKELGNFIRCHWSRDPRFQDVPTLLLDADADEEITARFFPKAEFVSIRAEWRNVEVIQCHDWTGSAMSLKGERRRDEVYNAVLDMADRLADQIDSPSRRPLLVSQKAVIDGYREAGDLKAAPFDTAHFGNLRGKDGWNEAVGVIVAGRIEPSPDALESLARSIWYAAAEPLQFLQPDEDGKIRLPFCQHSRTDKTGKTVEVSVSHHPDGRANRVLRQVREAEIMQAVARIRPVHRSAEIPCQVVVLTSVPLPLDVDRYASRAEIMPDRFDMARLAGFMPEIAQDMADAYPDLFKSKGAVRAAASRRPDRAFPAFEGRAGGVTESIYKINGVCNGWLFVSFERGSETVNRAGRAWVRHQPGDTPAKIAARVRQFLPDALDIDVRMPAPTGTAAEKAPAGRQEIKPIAVDRIAFAQSVGENLPWWEEGRRIRARYYQKNSLTKPRPVFVNPSSL